MLKTTVKLLLISVCSMFIFAANAKTEGNELNVSAIEGTPFEKHLITDKTGREITYYLSHPKNKSAPLLLMIQGSGCAPIINIQPKGTYSTLFNLMPFANEGEFAVLAVEKPFSGVIADGNYGTALPCSSKFNEDFTAETWLSALLVSVQSARQNSWVDKNRSLVLGISEGATMASLVASHDKIITDVISIGGSGTTQLFDFVASAYRNCFDRSSCINKIDQQVKAINADPSSTTQFAWGHTYKRWSSFMRVDPSNELMLSHARVYLAFGTSDESSPPLSQEIIYAKLLAANRDISVRRVVDGNHALSYSENFDMESLDKELRKALEWFWHKGVN